MQGQVERSEVVDIAQYEAIRQDFRAEVIALKENRRLFVGPHFHFLFENHQTVLYQIQEMMRVERIVEEKAILHEVKTYNELIPPKGGLSATLMLEYENEEKRAEVLPGLLGLEEHVWFSAAELEPSKAEFSRSQIGETRLSSVQYLTFPLSEAYRNHWLQAAEEGTLRLLVDPPRYAAETVVPPAVAQALAEDFS